MRNDQAFPHADPEPTGPEQTGDRPTGAPACDLSTTCSACGAPMRPEHAHYRCPTCGWRDSCCDGPY